MEIRRYSWNVIDANSWLIQEGHDGLLVDAVENEELYSAMSGMKSLTVILTHCHFDHITGLNRIRAIKPDTIVISTDQCSRYIGNPRKNTSNTANALLQFYHPERGQDVRIDPVICDPSDITFDREFVFAWRRHQICLSAVHGHTSDSLIAIMDDKLLFSGDTLLNIPTITRFPSGSTERFWEEDIPELKELNGVETVFPGHGAPGNLEDMLAVNKKPEKLRNAERR